MSSANPSELETNGNECLESKVPKSESSSSGVNEISDSSNNSIDDYNSRLNDVAEREKNGDIPAFKDVMDLMKFGYILQVRILVLYALLLRNSIPAVTIMHQENEEFLN